MFFAERRIMFVETEQLKQNVEEMLTSNDTEWVNTVRVTLNAMYKQFQLERKNGKQPIPLANRAIRQPQIGLICQRRTRGRLGPDITQLGFVLLIL
jgi:hypothetical protein